MLDINIAAHRTKGIGFVLLAKIRRSISILFFQLSITVARSQSTETFPITFDGEPPQPPETSYGVLEYYEEGMRFWSPNDLFVRNGGGFTLAPENGTAYLQAAFGQSLAFRFTDGTLFNLHSVDLAEYSTVLPDPARVPFVGYRADGTIVRTTFTTDGIIDGTGPLADFETFNFGPEFSGLTRVEIPGDTWSLDNVVVSVPEPSTVVFLSFGGAILWYCHRKRKTRRPTTP